MATYPDQYRKLLLHFNGADASQTIIEDGGKPFTANANAQLDTAQYKFGTASLLLDGFDDYIITPNHSDLAIGMSEFAIDFHLRFVSLPAAYQVDHICGHGDAGQNRWHLYLYNNNSKYDLYFVVYEGESVALTVVAQDLTLVTGSWYHFALTAATEGSGRRFRIFQSGVPKIAGGGTYSTVEIPAITGSFRIGTQFGNENFLNAWVDEFCLSIGTPRWTDTFTPPTEEYHYDADFTNAPLLMTLSAVIDVEPFGGILSITDFDLNENAFDFSLAPLILGGSILSDEPFIPNYGEIDFPLFQVSGYARTTNNRGEIVFPKMRVEGVALAGNIGKGEIVFPKMRVEGRLGLRGGINFPLFQVSGEAKTGRALRGEIEFSRFQVSGQATTGLAATGSIKFKVFQVNGIATQHFKGIGEIEFKRFKILGFGYTGTLGKGEIVFPKMIVEGRASFLAVGQGNIVFPTFVVSGYARQSIRERLSIVMNIRNRAITQYLNYGFNSFASINGVFYGARNDGIWKLEGAKDNGIQIDSRILTGVFDFWINGKKKPREIFATMRSNGRMILEVVIDEKDIWEDEFDFFLEQIEEAKSTFAKGIKDRFLSFGIRNKDGADFEIDSVRILVDKLGKVR